MRQKLLFAFKYFLLLFTVASIICLTIFLSIENKTVEAKVREIKLNEEMFVTLKSDYIIDSFVRAIQDVKYISDSFEISNQDNRAIWKVILDSNVVYSSIRYVDLNGNEKLRQNYSELNEVIDEQVSTENISDEPFFQSAIFLKEGQFFISNLINSTDEAEKSKTSMMFCMPVYSDDIVGVLVLELNAKVLMDRFGEHINDTESIVYLVNDFSYWDSISSGCKEIDTEYYEISYGAGLLPAEKWEEVKDSMHNLTNKGLYTVVELDFLSGFSDNLVFDRNNIVVNDNSYKIVSFVESDDDNQYYFSNEFHLKVGRVIASRYPYLILCFFVAALVAIYLLINKSNLEEIKNSSHYDPLTKTYNRRQGFVLLEDYIANIHHYRKICLCFVDINGLKDVNDTLGHPFGDELIVTVAETFKNAVRQEDIVIRMGGDEFLIVLMKVEKAIAETIWTRIAETFSSINSMEDRSYLISVSHGIVEVVDGESKIDISTLITEADAKMYKEKLRIKKNITIIRRKF